MTDTAEPEGPSEARARGVAKMGEVYSFPFDVSTFDAPGAFFAETVDHLFGEVWTRDGLAISERRLLTIGVIAARGLPDVLEIQFRSGLDRGEFTIDQLREIVLHLAYYVGWPLATIVNDVAERVIRKHEKAGAGDEA